MFQNILNFLSRLLDCRTEFGNFDSKKVMTMALFPAMVPASFMVGVTEWSEFLNSGWIAGVVFVGQILVDCADWLIASGIMSDASFDEIQVGVAVIALYWPVLTFGLTWTVFIGIFRLCYHLGEKRRCKQRLERAITRARVA